MSIININNLIIDKNLGQTHSFSSKPICMKDFMEISIYSPGMEQSCYNRVFGKYTNSSTIDSAKIELVYLINLKKLIGMIKLRPLPIKIVIVWKNILRFFL